MRIALISDIHYGKMSTTSELAVWGEKLDIGEVQNAKPLFDGFVDILKEIRPDYLFISGDLTSSGSPLEFKNCYDKILNLAESVGILSSNIIFCLGNHDIDWRISSLADDYFLDENAKENIAYLRKKYLELSYAWSIPAEGNACNIRPRYNITHTTPLTGVSETNDFIIFVLNSAHLCVKDQEFKHGCLSLSQLDWFRTVVQQYEQSAKVKIVLLHHHPFNYEYPLVGLDISTLEEGAELLSICGEAGVDIVIHGHRHHPKAKTISQTGWKKPVTYICSGSLSVNASHRLSGQIPNTFHIIECNTPDQILLNNYTYKSHEGWLLNSTNCPETPIDGEMLLGKCIDEERATTIVKDLPINEKIEYKSLHPDLRYLSIKKLNELIIRVNSGKYEVFGTFPDPVVIIQI